MAIHAPAVLVLIGSTVLGPAPSTLPVYAASEAHGPTAPAAGSSLFQEELPAPEAWAALERGNASKAAAIFREALDRSPRNPALHFGAGYAAYVLGRLDSAISSLKKALEYEPRFVQAAALLAQVAYERGDLDLAIRSMERAVALAPHDRLRSEQLARWKHESAVHEDLEERVDVRFRVMFEGTAQQPIADRISRVLERAYWQVGQVLNSYPSEAITVLLYTDRQFQDITRAPAWAGGEFDGRIRVAVAGALRTPAALDRVMVHEFVHAAIATLAPRGVPVWVHEGLASVLESKDQAWVSTTLGGTRQRLTLNQLAHGFDRLDDDRVLVAYAESAVAGRLLIERLGPNLTLFLQMLGSGHSVDQALSTLDVRPEEFEAEWRRRIGARVPTTR
jgi:tetratricopeptide (TPR) repeat protein